MDKLTYEQRVQQMAEKMAIELYDKSAFLPNDKWATLDDYGREVAIYSMVATAKIAVAAQAEAYLEGYVQAAKDYGHAMPYDDPDAKQYLVDNGYLPAPEVKDNISAFLNGEDINSPENEKK